MQFVQLSKFVKQKRIPTGDFAFRKFALVSCQRIRCPEVWASPFFALVKSDTVLESEFPGSDSISDSQRAKRTASNNKNTKFISMNESSPGRFHFRLVFTVGLCGSLSFRNETDKREPTSKLRFHFYHVTF